MRILLKNRLLLVLLLFIVLASVVAKSFWGIPAIIMIVAFHYVIPGIALQKLTGNIIYIDYNQLLFSSYSVGYALSIIVYLAMLILGLQRYVLFFSLAVLVSSLLYLKNDLQQLFKINDENTSFISIILFVCLSIAFLCFQLNYLSAFIVDYQNHYYDLIYWHRNAVAATISYPLPDLSLMSKKFCYHYFSSLGMADLHYVSGVDLPNLCYTYSYIINIPLVVGAVYLISSEFVKNRFLLITSCLLILLGTTFEPITFTNYCGHLYYCSFGFSEGFSLALLSFYYFHRIDEISIKSTFLPLLMFVVAVGCKAPVGMIALGGILFCCFSNFVYLKERKIIWLGVTYIILFLLVICYFVIDFNPNIEGAGNGSLSLSYDTVFYPPFFKEVFDYVYHVIPNTVISLIAVFISYIIINSYLFVVGAILVIRRNKQINWNNTELSFLFMFVSGYILFLFLAHSGFSQVYFYFIAIPFGFLYFFSIFDMYHFSLTNKEKGLVLMVCLMAIICLLYSIKSEVSSGIRLLFNHQSVEQEVAGNSLTSKELEALTWTRYNLPDSAILISNKYVAKRGTKCVVIGAYTERQTYMEGYEYSGFLKDKTISHRNKLLLDFFSGSVDALKIMKKEGVTHFVRFENIPVSLPDVGMKAIYKNGAVTVFEF